MAKPVISPEEFIEEANRRAPEAYGYEEGMRLFLVPKGSTGNTAGGYDWEPRSSATQGVFQKVVHQLHDEFDVDPTISRKPHG